MGATAGTPHRRIANTAQRGTGADHEVPLSKEELLRPVPIVAERTAEQLAKLAQPAVRRTFARAGVLIREGDSVAARYLLISGQVSSPKRAGPTGGDARLATLGRGALAGEMARLDGSPRSAPVTSLGTTECFGGTRWVFNTTLRSDPQIAVAMLPVPSRRIRQAHELHHK